MKKEQKNQGKNEKQKTTVPIKLCTPLVWMANILNVISKFQIKNLLPFTSNGFEVVHMKSQYENTFVKNICELASNIDGQREKPHGMSIRRKHM